MGRFQQTKPGLRVSISFLELKAYRHEEIIARLSRLAKLA